MPTWRLHWNDCGLYDGLAVEHVHGVIYITILPLALGVADHSTVPILCLLQYIWPCDSSHKEVDRTDPSYVTTEFKILYSKITSTN